MTAWTDPGGHALAASAGPAAPELAIAARNASPIASATAAVGTEKDLRIAYIHRERMIAGAPPVRFEATENKFANEAAATSTRMLFTAAGTSLKTPTGWFLLSRPAATL